MPPHDQTPPEVPLCRAGQKAYDGSTQSALIFAGFGIADVAAAAVVYRRALERGVGRICRGENTMRD
jgi:ornithine cyclodeaminase/alanine dehydrogenase-like protein (mu-crystallin family)